jgi:hypothetical protein
VEDEDLYNTGPFWVIALFVGISSGASGRFRIKTCSSPAGGGVTGELGGS